MELISKRALYFFSFFFLGLLMSCGNEYSPKPRGFYKIDLPEKKYQSFTNDCPFTFNYPVYSSVVNDSARNAKHCWKDVVYGRFNGRIHLSYEPITSRGEFNQLTEDAHTFVFKHTVKATAIDEAVISIPEKRVYGIYYTIDGNVASPVQFFLTDSSKHYLRGALYFREQPHLDSIQPVLDFIKKDIDVMIRSFQWTN
jgi:gliding motility-associated lipoprotein GldD